MKCKLGVVSDEPLLSIGQVAERAGLRTSRIRYYEEIGVLPEPMRVSGQRRYDEDVLHRLSIVDVAQRAGLTLDEIRELTGRRSREETAGDRLRVVAEAKLPEIRKLIARAQAVERWLEIAQNCDCREMEVCGLFVDPELAPPIADGAFAVRQHEPASAGQRA